MRSLTAGPLDPPRPNLGACPAAPRSVLGKLGVT